MTTPFTTPSLPRRAWLAPLVLATCATPPPTTTDADATSSAPVFAYLATRYDDDRNGSIEPHEYDRDGAEFARLDRDADGVITAADFLRLGRRVRPLREADARRHRARLLLAWYFQADATPADVRAAEFEVAFAAFDRDADGRLGRSEFERAAPERARHGRRPPLRFAGLLEVETTDPWERLVDGVDADGDGFLSVAELLAFHDREARAAAGNGWTVDAAELRPTAHTLFGTVAPDFTLPTLAGDAQVTLSRFRGERPVALVFGSYT